MAQHFGGAAILGALCRSPQAACCLASEPQLIHSLPPNHSLAGGPGNAVELSNPLLNVAESCLDKWAAAVDWQIPAVVMGPAGRR